MGAGAGKSGFDGLPMLSPNAKLLAGGLMIGCGLALAVASQLASTAGYVGLLLGVAVGGPMLRSGLADRRRLALEAAELARGLAEMPELRPAIAAAVAAGHHVGRLLKQRGYTSARVRRKLALECDVILQEGEAG